MCRTIYSTIRHIAGSQNKTKTAARIALSLSFLLSAFARPSSANIIYVTTLRDGIGTGSCSLKEAIYSSNLQTNIAISSYSQDSSGNFFPITVTTQCVPGSGNDIIVLPAGQVLQTVTANFGPCNCVVDVSGSANVTRGGFVFNFGTGRYVQTVTLTNVSQVALNISIYLVLDNLSSDASLFNANGLTARLFPPAVRT